MAKLSQTARFTKSLFIISALISYAAFVSGAKNKDTPKCEIMKVSQCRSFGYNVTGIPNIFGDKSQMDVERRLMAINELLTSTCAAPVRFFFCSMYAPMCSPKTGSLIMSCRPLCEHVTERCRPTAAKFKIPWLEAWNCSQFPLHNNKDDMCMPGPKFNETRLDTLYSTTRPRSGNDKMSFKNSQNYFFLDRGKSWVLFCDKDGIFPEDTKDFAELWMTIWAIVCFISTSVAVLTFLVDTQRFPYPERAIVMLAFCYNLYSIGFIVRIIFGHDDVACARDDSTQPPRMFITQQELGNPLCAFVFLFLYFFGMAANIWWVILALTWFLAAGMKWSYEAIGSYTNFFHLVAWLLPVVKTVLVLIFRKVDGDELTGLCYVGNQDLLALTGFVLGPQFTYLIIGTLFLFAGFIALYRIRLVVHKERLHKIDKLDRFIVRIGVFSVFSTVPATCIIATHFYEYSKREDWLYGRSEPNTKVLMLKICMPLFVGLISGAWMWTGKTFVAWRNFYMKTFKKHTQNSSNNNMSLRNEANARPFQDESQV